MTFAELIELAESIGHPHGETLAKALLSEGRVARDNGDGTTSIYWSESDTAWSKETIRNADATVVPE